MAGMVRDAVREQKRLYALPASRATLTIALDSPGDLNKQYQC